jgi:hypothetical protein
MTATITMAVANGVGQPQSSLSSDQIVKLQKVLALHTIPLSGLVLQINPARKERLALRLTPK